MMKNCPGEKGLSCFSDQFCESKTDPFAQANSDRACMKRWRSGRLNPYTPDKVSTYKRGLKWLTGNRYRDVT